MAQADHAYYIRRADEERMLVERAETPAAKAAHQQLRDLYLIQAGAPVIGLDFTVHGTARG